MKLWVKNFFYTITVIMVTMTISFIFLYIYMPIHYEKKQEDKVTTTLTTLTQKYEGQSIDDVIKDLKTQMFLNQGGSASYQLVNSNDKVLFQTTDDTLIVSPFNSTSLEEYGTEIIAEIYATELSKTFKDNDGKLYCLNSRLFKEEIRNASDVLLELFPLVLVFCLMIGTIIAVIYSRQSTKRIKKLSEATNYMLTVDSSYQCEVKGNDEITYLSKDINHLNQTLATTITALKKEIKKVEDSEQYKSYFFQSATHELKTPITIITGIIEGMRLNIGRYKDREKYLGVCQDLLAKQAYLIQELASIYRLENFESSEFVGVFSLDELILEQVALYETLSESSRRYFFLEIETFVMTEEKYLIKMLISNLISNAYRYAKKEGAISISLSNGVLQIENECIPLSNEDLEHVFKPFYRPDYARNQKDGGTGLGLFIVKSILDKKGYDYSFYATKKSMVFEVNFKSSISQELEQENMENL